MKSIPISSHRIKESAEFILKYCKLTYLILKRWQDDNFTQKISPTESIIFVSVRLAYLNYFGIITLSTVIWLQWTVLSLTQRTVIPVRWGPFPVVKQATTDRVFLCKYCQTSRLLDHSDLDLCWSTHSYLYPPRSQKKLYPWRVFLVLPEYFYILVFSS